MNCPSGSKCIRNILLVEDEQPLACGMISLLERHGFAVIAAKDGAEAIRVPEQHHVDLVITDIFMDGMDGLETVIHFKKTFPQIPIIAVSGGSPRIGVDCLRMAQHFGANRILRKPILIATLLETIHELEAERGPINRRPAWAATEQRDP